MIHIEGKGGIAATMILDSVSLDAHRLTTILVRAPKFIDAEFEKHRVMTSNSSSDRAVPFAKLSEQADYLPFDVRLNQPGMQGDKELIGSAKARFHRALGDIRRYTIDKLSDWDVVHKQHLNRYLLGFSWQYKLITATEWRNFYHLRLAGAAAPEIQEAARCMRACMNVSTPRVLEPGEWHLPFIEPEERERDDVQLVSGGRCARTSFRNHDGTEPVWDKDLGLANRLIEDEHWSPFEHQAMPMRDTTMGDRCVIDGWERGITHMDRHGRYWSGNFRGFVQHRQLLQEWN